MDREYELHRSAWLNLVVNQTETKGKKEVYKFKKFEEFFDYDALLGEKSEKKKLATQFDNKELRQLILKANSKKGGK